MIWNFLILVLAVVAGAFIARSLQSIRGMSVKVMLTFSGAYLLGIGVFHLLPEIYASTAPRYGLFIMGGFLIQLVLEVYSKGLEHGHGHFELFKKPGLPVAVLASLFFHAFLESIPLGSHTHDESRQALLWGVAVHKIPVSIILYAMFRQFTSSKRVITGWLLLFAAMAPLGMAAGEYIPLFRTYSRELTAVVFGIFLHISTTILFESDESHRFNILKLGITLIALAVAWLSVLA